MDLDIGMKFQITWLARQYLMAMRMPMDTVSQTMDMVSQPTATTGSRKWAMGMDTMVSPNTGQLTMG